MIWTSTPSPKWSGNHPIRPGRDWRDGDAWLAGGTWLFSDQQPDLRRLIDLMPLGWDTLAASDAGLEIGAMCTIRDLYAFCGARRLAGRPAVHHQLRGLPGVVQGVELGDGRAATSACPCPRAR